MGYNLKYSNNKHFNGNILHEINSQWTNIHGFFAGEYKLGERGIWSGCQSSQLTIRIPFSIFVLHETQIVLFSTFLSQKWKRTPKCVLQEDCIKQRKAPDTTEMIRVKRLKLGQGIEELRKGEGDSSSLRTAKNKMDQSFRRHIVKGNQENLSELRTQKSRESNLPTLHLTPPTPVLHLQH